MPRLARLRALATQPAAALIALLLGVYAYFYQAGGWNQNSRVDLVRSVVERGSLRIDGYQQNSGDLAKKDGHWYCDKAPGASWLAMPTYAVMYAVAGAPRPAPPWWLAWAVWLSIVIAVGVPSAIAAAFLARLARRLGAGERGALVIALGWGLGSMALPYATLFYGNQVAADCLIIAFALLVEIRDGAPATAARMIAVGGLLGFAGATEYPAALIAAPVAVYGLGVAGWRPARWAVLGGAVPLAALLAYHAAAFGSPFHFPYAYSVWKEPSTGWFMGIGVPHRRVLRDILVGDYRGMLSTTPWLALAVPGAVLLVLRRRGAEVAVCAWSVIAFLWLNASLPPRAWHGGWAAGPRYLVPMLPFAAALATGVVAGIAERLRATQVWERAVAIAAALALAGLLVFSAANMFAATAVKPEIDAAIRRPYAAFVWPNFRAGRLAVSRQSIEMKTNPPEGPRAAWNLGMKLGLDGHASLIPLYLLLLAGVTFMGRNTRTS